MHEDKNNGAPSKTGRPFPWVCPNCRKKDVRLAIVPYSTERLLDGRLIAVEIPHLNVPKCSNCGELVINYSTDEQIMDALRSHAFAGDPGGP